MIVADREERGVSMLFPVEREEKSVMQLVREYILI